MKLKTVAITALSFLAIGSLVFTSCQRERDTDTTETTETALLERTNDDVLNIADQGNTGSLGQFKTRGGCATVTRDTINIPHTITIDFGTTNCLGQDGKNRRGIINVSYTGKYKDSGSVKTITSSNFYVNDNKVVMNKTVVNHGKNAAGNTYYTIDAIDSIYKANNAGTIAWTTSRMREFTAGENTVQWIDDMYKVTGTASGMRANGLTWSMNITQPLVIDCSCVYHIVSGQMQMQPQGKALRTMDYGNGACDNAATVTINNKTFNITFK
jgi:hypothetical protein